VINGADLEANPLDMMSEQPERFETISLIIGANNNDASVFILDFDKIDPNINGTYMTNEMYMTFLEFLHPGLTVFNFTDRYKPRDSDGDIKYSLAAERLLTDMAFKCPARNISSMLPHSYLYEYNANEVDSELLQNVAESLAQGAERMMEILQVFHGSEIPVVFSWTFVQTSNADLKKASEYIYKDLEKGKERMGCLWGSFARDGYPNCKDVPEWPQFQATAQALEMEDNYNLKLIAAEDTGPSYQDCSMLAVIQPGWRQPSNFSVV
jgi:carboxylesterase type B